MHVHTCGVKVHAETNFTIFILIRQNFLYSLIKITHCGPAVPAVMSVYKSNIVIYYADTTLCIYIYI